MSVSNASSELEQILVINSCHGTSHIYNLNLYQEQNHAPILKTDIQYDGNQTQMNYIQEYFLRQKVFKLEAALKFKYHDGKNGNNQTFVDSNEGYLSKFTDMIQSKNELNHLVSTVRQQYDAVAKSYQYQL